MIQPSRPQTATAGFTLLEVLVALAILSISLVALYRISGSSVRQLGDVQDSQDAMMLAQSLLQSRDGVPEAGWSERGQTGNITWAVQSSPLPPREERHQNTPLHQVAIHVSWTSRGTPRQLDLATILPQQKPVVVPKP